MIRSLISNCLGVPGKEDMDCTYNPKGKSRKRYFTRSSDGLLKATPGPASILNPPHNNPKPLRTPLKGPQDFTGAGPASACSVQGREPQWLEKPPWRPKALQASDPFKGSFKGDIGTYKVYTRLYWQYFGVHIGHWSLVKGSLPRPIRPHGP